MLNKYNKVFFGKSLKKQILNSVLEKRKFNKSFIQKPKKADPQLDEEWPESFLTKSFDSALNVLKDQIAKPLRSVKRRKLNRAILLKKGVSLDNKIIKRPDFLNVSRVPK